MQVFDLPVSHIERQLVAAEALIKDIQGMLKVIPTEDFPSGPQAVMDYRKKFIAQTLVLADIAQCLVSKSIIPHNVAPGEE